LTVSTIEPLIWIFGAKKLKELAFLEYKKKYIAEIQQYTYANLENNLKQKLNNKHQ